MGLRSKKFGLIFQYRIKGTVLSSMVIVEHLRIAFEYNRPRHRIAARKKFDSEKRKICCRRGGITLISIPSRKKSLATRTKCIKLSKEIPQNFSEYKSNTSKR